jgi:hypothetical protein
VETHKAGPRFIFGKASKPLGSVTVGADEVKHEKHESGLSFAHLEALHTRQPIHSIQALEPEGKGSRGPVRLETKENSGIGKLRIASTHLSQSLQERQRQEVTPRIALESKRMTTHFCHQMRQLPLLVLLLNPRLPGCLSDSYLRETSLSVASSSLECVPGR